MGVSTLLFSLVTQVTCLRTESNRYISTFICEIPNLYQCQFHNVVFSLQGIQYLCSLQDLNLYYNNIPSLVEVSRLQPLPFLKELDLRLNPVVRKDTDYRLFAVYTLQTLEKLGETLLPSSLPQNLT